MKEVIKEHWENIYASKKPTGVSWFKPHLSLSLKLIEESGLHPENAIIDVGGGASTLVDDLIVRKFEDITILDISACALSISKKRLGSRANKVKWMEADITCARLDPNRYDIWHDRAVFHFLTHADDRRKYIQTLKSSLKNGGHLIIAAFNLSGPLKCSGLETVRYSPESFSEELGGGFRLLASYDETHQTPFNTVQNFVYSHFLKTTG